MQNWALQQVLLSLGHTVVTISRGDDYPSVTKLMRRSLSLFKCLVYKYLFKRSGIVICNPFAESYITRVEVLKHMATLREFVNENISTSPIIRSTKYLFEYIDNNKIECVVVGSDQVWREEYSPSIKDFFLDFLSERDDIIKISYAASFGADNNYISEKHLPKCISLAERFDAISVRERSGMEIINNVFRLNAELVSDPTLLLSSRDYEKLINAGDIIDGGLVTYILDATEEKSAIIDLVGVPAMQMSIFPQISVMGGGIPSNLSFSEWLGAFAGASFVVTDSFHGCVFSIIFKKPFIAIANKSRGLDRFTTLLDNLHLRDRMVFGLSQYLENKESLSTTIDYMSVYKYLDVERLKSMAFLINSLNITKE